MIKVILLVLMYYRRQDGQPYSLLLRVATLKYSKNSCTKGQKQKWRFVIFKLFMMLDTRSQSLTQGTNVAEVSVMFKRKWIVSELQKFEQTLQQQVYILLYPFSLMHVPSN